MKSPSKAAKVFRQYTAYIKLDVVVSFDHTSVYALTAKRLKAAAIRQTLTHFKEKPGAIDEICFGDINIEEEK